MLTLPREPGDADGFLSRVEQILGGVCGLHGPDEVIVVRIDNWFDRSWLRFSGKVLGALGVHRSGPTVPPFVPNRVVWQRRYRRRPDGAGYDQADPGQALHVSQTSAKNLSRKLPLLVEDAVILWFSGESEKNGRGALMTYVVAKDGVWSWYAGFTAGDPWKVSQVKGISKAELEALSGGFPPA